uniref:DNA2/NAM7 helicase-like C-terminal domain-containing protein n=1 Tax=Labrus bergylta TaxID=56723 RepID=A0A3Q3EFJ5_9LABR
TVFINPTLNTCVRCCRACWECFCRAWHAGSKSHLKYLYSGNSVWAAGWTFVSTHGDPNTVHVWALSGYSYIAILAPYNAQVTEINQQLKKKKLDKITATTITKSQGSEWRYVIISTVCSLPSEEIESEPYGAWLSKHLGFVGNPNQINVAITRAKEGLCIIGNQELLSCSRHWNKLLKHYTRSLLTVTCNSSIDVFLLNGDEEVNADGPCCNLNEISQVHRLLGQ